MNDYSEYFEGKYLYGDEFTSEQIAEWYQDEEDAYFNLGIKDRENYKYGYHILNYEHGFSFLLDKSFSNVLSVGGAYGDELQPIRSKINSIIIMESSLAFSEGIMDDKIRYIKSQPTGKISFSDNTFDMITCFGTLHHIPNVTSLINELYRCVKMGGYVLIREPIVSMGDWRKPRKGATKRERGIPFKIFRKIVTSAGFRVIKEKKCMFSLTSRLRYFCKDSVYNSKIAIKIDNFLCYIFGWNTTYHTTNIFLKLRPTSVFYILQK